MSFLNWIRGKPSVPLSPQEFLTQIQRKFPPKSHQEPQGDLGLRSYERLAPRFPPDVRNLFLTGKVAIGEVGILTPNAFVEYVPTGYVIQVYSGLSSFLYRVSRALHTRVTIWPAAIGASPKTQPTVEPEETMEILAVIFNNFMSDGKIAGPSSYPIHQEQKEAASNLATHAEDFVVAHEVGHIMVWLRNGGEPVSLSPDEEFEADKLALAFLLGARADLPSINWRLLRLIYAGAEFALRVYSSLNHLGYKFETTHPLPGVRLQKLREMAIDICGSRRAFVELTTIAFGYDQLLESMERKIAEEAKSARAVVSMTPERLLSTLSVVTEEVAVGRLTLDWVISDLIKIFSVVSKDIIREGIRQAALMYFVEDRQNSNVETAAKRLQERETFKKIASRMPEQFNSILEEVIGSASTTPLNQLRGIELERDHVLSMMQRFVAELLSNSDVNDLISIKPVDGQPGQMQVLLAPKKPEKIAIIKSARSCLLSVSEDIRKSAREHASDIYQTGTLEYSMLLALLGTVKP